MGGLWFYYLYQHWQLRATTLAIGFHDTDNCVRNREHDTSSTTDDADREEEGIWYRLRVELGRTTEGDGARAVNGRQEHFRLGWIRAGYIKNIMNMRKTASTWPWSVMCNICTSPVQIYHLCRTRRIGAQEGNCSSENSIHLLEQLICWNTRRCADWWVVWLDWVEQYHQQEDGMTSCDTTCTLSTKHIQLYLWRQRHTTHDEYQLASVDIGTRVRPPDHGSLDHQCHAPYICMDPVLYFRQKLWVLCRMRPELSFPEVVSTKTATKTPKR